MDVEGGDELLGVGVGEGLGQLEDAGDGLPTVFVLQPLGVGHGVGGHRLYEWEVLLYELDFLVYAGFIETHQVCCMDLQPS